jgi:hypothetical protein
MAPGVIAAAQENSVQKIGLKKEKRGKRREELKKGDITIDVGATSPRPQDKLPVAFLSPSNCSFANTHSKPLILDF